MNIIVKIANYDKNYYFNNQANLELKAGDKIIVENNQIIEVGQVKDFSDDNDDSSDVEPGVGRIIRLFNLDDKKIVEQNRRKAKEFLQKSREIVEKSPLNMKMIDTQLSHDGKKLTIYFSAEGRVDFRELLLEMVKKFHKLIRLQQIGSRDQAKLQGGFGKCGRELCCKSFLSNLDTVTLDMAKEQNLGSGINKVSGACGKLMCCLNYELETYKQLRKKFPGLGEKIRSSKGVGKVIEQHLIKNAITVELENGEKVKVDL